MRMLVCYLDSHEAGLCCYLVIHIKNLLHSLQPFYFHFWLIYRLSLLILKITHFALPRSKYCPANFVFKPRLLIVFLRIRDRVSHPYKASEIFVLYILIFWVWGCKRSVKLFLNWVVRIYSWSWFHYEPYLCLLRQVHFETFLDHLFHAYLNFVADCGFTSSSFIYFRGYSHQLSADLWENICVKLRGL
jgi:hypothetical protein